MNIVEELSKHQFSSYALTNKYKLQLKPPNRNIYIYIYNRGGSRPKSEGGGRDCIRGGSRGGRDYIRGRGRGGRDYIRGAGGGAGHI